MAQPFNGMRKRVMSNVVQQGSYYQRLDTTERDAYQPTIFTTLQQCSQSLQRQMIAPKTMLIARMGRSRPDPIDKTQLLNLLKAQKSRRTD